MSTTQAMWLLAIGAALASGCSSRYALEKVREIEGLDVPESMLVDPDDGTVYITNMEDTEGEYWSSDGNAFISLLTPEGAIDNYRWIDSSDAPFHSPKGMCILDGYLYFADVEYLKRVSLTGAEPVQIVPGITFEQANDVATDGTCVWVSDMGQGRVFCVDPGSGTWRDVPAPDGVNGIALHEGRLYAVSWDLHDVYELDPEGQALPKAYGLAEHFTNLDGLIVLEDGSLIVSDFYGDKVSWVSADGKTVRTLAEIGTPADMGFDRRRRLLYVPQFKHARATVFRLVRKGPFAR